MSTSFPEGRWRRAGAHAREILDLGAEWQALREEERAVYEQDVAGVSDSELRNRLQQWRDGLATADGESTAPSDQPPAQDESSQPAAPPETTPVDPATVTPADPATVTPAAPAGQPAADPDATTLAEGEQVAEGTSQPMVESTTGEVIGDGTGTALPPIPDDGTGTPLPPADPATDPEAPSPAPGSEADEATTGDPAPFVPTDEDLQSALSTAANAAAYISAYPDPAIRERLLVLESEGKARKSVLDILANNDE